MARGRHLARRMLTRASCVPKRDEVPAHRRSQPEEITAAMRHTLPSRGAKMKASPGLVGTAFQMLSAEAAIRKRDGDAKALPTIILIPLFALIGFLAVIVSSFVFSGISLPSCDSEAAISPAREAIDKAPIGNAQRFRIIDFWSPTEVSHSDTEVRCAALVKLNNATQGELRYRLYVKRDRVFVEARLSGLR